MLSTYHSLYTGKCMDVEVIGYRNGYLLSQKIYWSDSQSNLVFIRVKSGEVWTRSEKIKYRTMSVCYTLAYLWYQGFLKDAKVLVNSVLRRSKAPSWLFCDNRTVNPADGNIATVAWKERVTWLLCWHWIVEATSLAVFYCCLVTVQISRPPPENSFSLSSIDVMVLCSRWTGCFFQECVLAVWCVSLWICHVELQIYPLPLLQQAISVWSRLWSQGKKNDPKVFV